MARLNVSPTRMELNRLKKRLSTARKGHKLMKDKRDELMKQFLDSVRKNQELRIKTEKLIEKSQKNFAMAGALMSDLELQAALAYPSRHIEAEMTEKSLMGVKVPAFTYRIDDKGSPFCYGFNTTNGALDESIVGIYELMDSLLELASVEKSCQLLASEIEKTRRRVNALEYVMIPQLEETIHYIMMKMEENDRSTKTRLIKVKDMVLENK